MSGIESALRTNLRDAEYSDSYAESFLNAYIATQIKVIREQRQMTQVALAEKIGTTQAGVSRIEDVNYSSWNIRTLTKIARAFAVRLRVSFEPFGTLPSEVANFDRKSLERVSREADPQLLCTDLIGQSVPIAGAAQDVRRGRVVSIKRSRSSPPPYAGSSAEPIQKEAGWSEALCK